MPGTVRLEFYTMPLADALALLMADKDDLLTLGMSTADVGELRHAARVVVEQHAEEVVARYASLHNAPSVLRLAHDGGV